MAALTPVGESELQALLSRYDLGTLNRYWPASHGIENSNYFLDLSGREGRRQYVLTLMERPSYAGELLVPLLDLADAAGLPVAPIVRNRAAAAMDELRGKPTLIAPRLIGRHVVNPTLRQCSAVGRFLARFHKVAGRLSSAAPRHPRDAGWLRGCAGRLDGLVSYGDASLLRHAVGTVTSLLERDDVAALPGGVIHGDLFRDNVLFAGRGLTGVLDFHQAAAGLWLYDLAVAANDWCTDTDGLLDAERTLALLRAYHSFRPLTAQELWFFAPFTVYAALAFWLSRLDVAFATRTDGKPSRSKNPDELRRTLQAQLAHPFYPDARLL